MTDLCVANLMSVSTGPAQVARIARKVLDLNADAYLLCECADVDLRTIAPEGWTVIQHGPIGSPASALAVIARPGVVVSRDSMRRGTPKGGRGRRRVRQRPILFAQVRDVRVNVGHAPLPGTGLNRMFMSRLKATRGSKFGDLNLRHTSVARWFRRFDVHSAGVLHAVIPKRRRSTVVARIPGRDLAGADHAALIVRVPPL